MYFGLLMKHLYVLFISMCSRIMASQVRQNFHQECEAAINRQVYLELYASYVYLSMVREQAFIIRVITYD